MLVAAKLGKKYFAVVKAVRVVAVAVGAMCSSWRS
jgi:hypothetical protein